MMRGLLVAAAGMPPPPSHPPPLPPRTRRAAPPRSTSSFVPPRPACARDLFAPASRSPGRSWSARAGRAERCARSTRGVVGDPVELPATPGTYTFPAPHVFGGGACPGPVGIVQTTGSHAIVTREAASTNFLTVKREGQADERIDGARLTTSIIVEPDKDHDLRGDMTEDRTDLRVSAKPAREADGRARVEVTVTNAGPARRRSPGADDDAARRRPLGGRVRGRTAAYPTLRHSALRAGRVADVRPARRPARRGQRRVSIASEGADLVAADNKADDHARRRRPRSISSPRRSSG